MSGPQMPFERPSIARCWWFITAASTTADHEATRASPALLMLSLRSRATAQKISSLTVEFMKDGEAGAEIVSKLEFFEIGLDEDGEAIKCGVVVEAEAPAKAVREAKLKPNELTVLQYRSSSQRKPADRRVEREGQRSWAGAKAQSGPSRHPGEPKAEGARLRRAERLERNI